MLGILYAYYFVFVGLSSKIEFLPPTLPMHDKGCFYGILHAMYFLQ